MNQFFSRSPIWLVPTDAIRNLHNRPIQITRDSDSDMWLLSVEHADSKASLAGQCAVKITHRGASPTMATVLSLGEDASQQATWSQSEYLHPDAVGLIAYSSSCGKNGVLTMVLPTAY